jgi:hypothetical protein
MPAIAAQGIERYQPSFYWHLGDLRAIYKIDEDMAAAAEKTGQSLSCESYHRRAWQDFIDHQIVPFGTTRFYLGIGNHEVIPPKTPAEILLPVSRLAADAPSADGKPRTRNRSLQPKADRVKKLPVGPICPLRLTTTGSGAGLILSLGSLRVSRRNELRGAVAF